jgi:hypothetical protein
MPQTYYDFNPWARAANNIAEGMVAVSVAKNRRAMFDAEMAQRQPLVEAQTRKTSAEATGLEDQNDWHRTLSNLMPLANKVISEGTMQNDDGTISYSPDALKMMGTVMSYQAKGANDYGGGIESVIRAGNFTQEAAKDRASREKINDADNKAAGERPFELSPGAALYDKDGKLIVNNPSAASASAGSNPFVDSVKDANTAMAKFIAENGVPTEDDKPDLRKRYIELQSHALDMKREWLKYSGRKETDKKPLTESAPSAQGGNTPATNAVPARIVKGPDGKAMWAQ